MAMPDWTLKRLYHINISVTDLDRSVEFYQLLGFEVRSFVTEADHDFSLLQGPAELGLGYPKFKSAVMFTPDKRSHALLDLVQWTDPPSPTHARSTAMDIGVARVALWLDDVSAAREALVAQGVQFEVGVLGPDPDNGMGCMTLVRDPDGLIIELIDFPRGYVRPVAK